MTRFLMPAMSAPWDVAGTIVLTSDEMCGGLPDHLEVAHDSIDRLAIGLELFECEPGDVGVDPRSRVENVLDAKTPIPRRQPLPR